MNIEKLGNKYYQNNSTEFDFINRLQDKIKYSNSTEVKHYIKQEIEFYERDIQTLGQRTLAIFHLHNTHMCAENLLDLLFDVCSSSYIQDIAYILDGEHLLLIALSLSDKKNMNILLSFASDRKLEAIQRINTEKLYVLFSHSITYEPNHDCSKYITSLVQKMTTSQQVALLEYMYSTNTEKHAQFLLQNTQYISNILCDIQQKKDYDFLTFVIQNTPEESYGDIFKKACRQSNQQLAKFIINKVPMQPICMLLHSLLTEQKRRVIRFILLQAPIELNFSFVSSVHKNDLPCVLSCLPSRIQLCIYETAIDKKDNALLQRILESISYNTCRQFLEKALKHTNIQAIQFITNTTPLAVLYETVKNSLYNREQDFITSITTCMSSDRFYLLLCELAQHNDILPINRLLEYTKIHIYCEQLELAQEKENEKLSIFMIQNTCAQTCIALLEHVSQESQLVQYLAPLCIAYQTKIVVKAALRTLSSEVEIKAIILGLLERDDLDWSLACELEKLHKDQIHEEILSYALEHDKTQYITKILLKTCSENMITDTIVRLALQYDVHIQLNNQPDQLQADFSRKNIATIAISRASPEIIQLDHLLLSIYKQASLSLIQQIIQKLYIQTVPTSVFTACFENYPALEEQPHVCSSYITQAFSGLEFSDIQGIDQNFLEEALLHGCSITIITQIAKNMTTIAITNRILRSLSIERKNKTGGLYIPSVRKKIFDILLQKASRPQKTSHLLQKIDPTLLLSEHKIEQDDFFTMTQLRRDLEEIDEDLEDSSE